jgi:hypothetical protein
MRKWPSGEKYVPSVENYAALCVSVIESFYAYGFRKFQIDNEPDLSWADAGYTPPSWQTIPEVWAWFIGEAFFNWQTGVRYSVPPDVQLGFTPMKCPSKESEDWYEAAQEWRQAGTNKSLMNCCDFITAHAYWQANEHYSWEEFGRNYKRVQRYTGTHQPIYVTEAACSSDAIDIEDRRTRFYPIYLGQARRDGVAGVYFYILGSNPEWAKFRLSNRVCDALGRRVTGGSRPANAL